MRPNRCTARFRRLRTGAARFSRGWLRRCTRRVITRCASIRPRSPMSWRSAPAAPTASCKRSPTARFPLPPCNSIPNPSSAKTAPASSATRSGSDAVTGAYVHGYDPRENLRLQDQACTLVELLHADTLYPDGSSVLEAGCGVGAQTIPLAKKSPKALITSIDASETSVAEARKSVTAAGVTNVTVRQGDIFNLPFSAESFDHVFVCFVLEHVAQPMEALRALKHVLKPNGTITVIEGDHGSAYFHPDSDYAREAIRCLVELQARAGGNALIGRALYPLLKETGFDDVRVSPRMVYVDGS